MAGGGCSVQQDGVGEYGDVADQVTNMGRNRVGTIHGGQRPRPRSGERPHWSQGSASFARHISATPRPSVAVMVSVTVGEAVAQVACAAHP